jgi:hypothetical protein
MNPSGFHILLRFFGAIIRITNGGMPDRLRAQVV